MRAAQRLGIGAGAGAKRAVNRVVVDDGDAISVLLSPSDAHAAVPGEAGEWGNRSRTTDTPGLGLWRSRRAGVVRAASDRGTERAAHGLAPAGPQRIILARSAIPYDWSTDAIEAAAMSSGCPPWCWARCRSWTTTAPTVGTGSLVVNLSVRLMWRWAS